MIKNKTIKNDHESQWRKQIGRERGERIKVLRLYCGYSRRAFCSKYAYLGINIASLQSWEDVRWYGVSERGVSVLVEAFRAEGLSVTAEWLMFGIGSPPIKEYKAINQDNLEIIYDSNVIMSELQNLLQLHESMVDQIIKDDANAPLLQRNDRVAGPRFLGSMIEEVIGQVCIVDTVNQVTLVRKLEKGTIKGCYNLVALNPHASEQMCIENEVIYSAAPVVWVRKVVRPRNKVSMLENERSQS